MLPSADVQRTCSGAHAGADAKLPANNIHCLLEPLKCTSFCRMVLLSSLRCNLTTPLPSALVESVSHSGTASASRASWSSTCAAADAPLLLCVSCFTTCRQLLQSQRIMITCKDCFVWDRSCGFAAISKGEAASSTSSTLPALAPRLPLRKVTAAL